MRSADERAVLVRMMLIFIVTTVCHGFAPLNSTPAKTPRSDKKRAFLAPILKSSPSDRIPEVGAGQIAGSDPDRPQKVNQDRHFACRFRTSASSGNERPYITCAGVMDGHGLKGHIVTDFLKNRLPLRLKRQIVTKKDDEEPSPASSSADDVRILTEMKERLIALGRADDASLFYLTDEGSSDDDNPLTKALVRSFVLSHHDAGRDPDVPSGRSGTTCVVCLIDEGVGELYVANVGDSRAILGNYDSETACANATALSRETTTSVMTERERIDNSEGSIRNGNVFYGPVGIAMTRALGDSVMLRAGVLPVPEVSVYDISREGREGGRSFVVLGTDGVFDVLTNERVVTIVGEQLQMEGGDVNSAAHSVAKEAKEAWLGGLPIEVKVDDITCVVILL